MALFPLAPEVVTLRGVGSQTPCWPAATQLEECYRQPVGCAAAQVCVEEPVRRSELCSEACRGARGGPACKVLHAYPGESLGMVICGFVKRFWPGEVIVWVRVLTGQS